MIKLLRQIDDNWFEGENANNVGILPSSYIEVSNLPMHLKTLILLPLKNLEYFCSQSEHGNRILSLVTYFICFTTLVA